MKSENNYNLLLGRFCQSKKTLSETLDEAIWYKTNCLMIFLGSPRGFKGNRLYSDLEISEFKEKLKKNNLLIENVIVHSPYYINLGNVLKKEISENSVLFLIELIKIMKHIGLKVLVIHPGSSFSESDSLVSIKQISFNLDKIITEINNKFPDYDFKILLETTCKKNEMGKKIDNLKKIINLLEDKEKNVGICWDTCHLFSSGYDIRSELGLEKFINLFDEEIGLKKLFLIHLNDSKVDLGSEIDRHENIGLGKIGLVSLKRIVWHPKLNGIPKILETPRKEWDKNLEEIDSLRN